MAKRQYLDDTTSLVLTFQAGQPIRWPCRIEARRPDGSLHLSEQQVGHHGQVITTSRRIPADKG